MALNISEQIWKREIKNTLISDMTMANVYSKYKKPYTLNKWYLIVKKEKFKVIRKFSKYKNRKKKFR